MFSLTGSFVREELAEIVQDKLPLYPFRLFFGPNQMLLYSIKREDMAKWVKELKSSIGYSNLSDFYEMKVPQIAKIGGRKRWGRGSSDWFGRPSTSRRAPVWPSKS